MISAGPPGRTALPDRRATPGAVADLVAAAALWGGMYVVSAATFAQIPPLTLAVLRLAVGAATLAIALRGRLGFGAAPAGRVVAAGAVVAFTIVLQFVGTSLTGGAEGAVLTTTTPAFVLVFGVALEGQRIRAAGWAGVAVALAGVTILAARNGSLVAPSGHGWGPLAGDLLLVASAAAWALFSSVGRPLVERVGAFRAILQASCVAIVLLVPLVPLELAGRPLPALKPATVGAVLYLGVAATAFAWSLWYRGYAAAPATVSAAAFFAQPVVGAALGVALLGEVLGAAFFGGAVLVGLGVLLIAAAGPVPRSERQGAGPAAPVAGAG